MRSWLGWIAGLAFTAAGLLWWFWPRLTPPEPRSTLVLALHGDLPERLAPTPLPDQASLLVRWLRLRDGRAETPLSMLEIAQVLPAAARDPRIVRLRIEPAGLRAGWAKLEELRTWIAAFARSGKPVDCYLRAPGMKEYFVASAASPSPLPDGSICAASAPKSSRSKGRSTSSALWPKSKPSAATKTPATP